MKPIRILIAANILVTAAWLTLAWFACHQTWKARQWKRLYDTANAQSELALKWKHQQHTKP